MPPPHLTLSIYCLITGNQKLNENELRYELGIELQASEEANDTLAIEHLQMDLHNTALTCRVDNTLTADEETLLLNVRGRWAKVKVRQRVCAPCSMFWSAAN